MPEFTKLNVPLLILSDPPEALTGLGRVCRDIASLASTMPEFRVGVLARAGEGRVKFPWTQYSYPVDGQWGEECLPRVWRDFSRGSPGIVMSNWDISRLGWLSRPENLPRELAEFYGPGRNFRTVLYSPVDGTGPDGRSLPTELRHYLAGWDRVCAASWWGREVMRSSGRPDAEFLPHGLWMDKFHPVAGARALAGWTEDRIVVGAVMANQARKDFPAWAEALAILRGKFGSRLRAWLHTDVLIRAWNVPALVKDFGLDSAVEVTTESTDEQLAVRLSACSVTMLPTRGEGFGLPIAESLACGTPCVTTAWAGGAELVPAEWSVEPTGWTLDSIWNLQRAQVSGHGFARKVEDLIARVHAAPEDLRAECAARVDHLGWPKLRWLWEKWLRSLAR